ncbi:MAG: hypothetical protein IPH20_04155 [Bacteroidales bacterium]|nr:hypothetical protein [Bacteroidales bacterium]
MKIPESYKTLIGLILLGFIVMVYSYYSNRPVIRDNLTEISGQLQNNPRIITWVSYGLVQSIKVKEGD